MRRKSEWHQSCSHAPSRFDRALASRRNTPSRSWKDIIHELGYFDQADFIRERHAFAGLPPGGFVGEWDNIFFPADD
ncbi:hypothetical protein [Bradyrhizobium sp. S3.5.5]|uniref:hypothetical protein n=1 Tax=Bradyrhizobium sp. S3.5.5 TaxID=3156430 RepID=UPI003397CB04